MVQRAIDENFIITSLLCIMNMNNNYFAVKKCYGQDRSDRGGSYGPAVGQELILVSCANSRVVSCTLAVVCSQSACNLNAY